MPWAANLKGRFAFKQGDSCILLYRKADDSWHLTRRYEGTRSVIRTRHMLSAGLATITRLSRCKTRAFARRQI